MYSFEIFHFLDPLDKTCLGGKRKGRRQPEQEMTGRTYEIYLPGGSSSQAEVEKISPYKNSRRDFPKCTVESYALEQENTCEDCAEVRIENERGG